MCFIWCTRLPLDLNQKCYFELIINASLTFECANTQFNSVSVFIRIVVYMKIKLILFVLVHHLHNSNIICLLFVHNIVWFFILSEREKRFECNGESVRQWI